MKISKAQEIILRILTDEELQRWEAQSLDAVCALHALALISDEEAQEYFLDSTHFQEYCENFPSTWWGRQKFDELLECLPKRREGKFFNALLKGGLEGLKENFLDIKLVLDKATCWDKVVLFSIPDYNGGAYPFLKSYDCSEEVVTEDYQYIVFQGTVVDAIINLDKEFSYEFWGETLWSTTLRRMIQRREWRF